MKKLLAATPLLFTLACAGQSVSDETLRNVILIAIGVVSVVLLILFGKPNANKRKQESKSERSQTK